MKVFKDIAETYITDVDVCDGIIHLFENSELHKRLTGSKKTIKALTSELKESDEIDHNSGRNCIDTSVFIDRVYEEDSFKFMIPFFEEMKYFLAQYEEKTNLFSWPVILLEAFNIQKYIPPHGVYSALHYEHTYESEVLFRRMYVWCLYLNDVEEGGETYFPKQKFKIKPKKGKLVFFPAFYTHPHKGLKSPHLKYIMTGWFSAVLQGETPDELVHAYRDLKILDKAKPYFNYEKTLII